MEASFVYQMEPENTNSIRYLGVYLKAARQYCCLFSQAKRSYYRAFNAVYGKVGSSASS